MKLKLRVNTTLLLYILILLPIFKPAAMTAFGIVDTFFKGMKLMSLTILFITVILKWPKGGSHKRLLAPVSLIGFWAIYIFNNFRFHTDLGGVVNNALTSILLIVFICVMSESRKYIDFFAALNFIFTLWIVIQSLSLLLINSSHAWFGMTGNGYNYFLGLDNYSAFITIPMIGILMYMDYILYGKIRRRNIFLFIALFIGYIYVRSATAVAALLILSFFLLGKGFWKKLKKLISIRKILVLLGVLLILIYKFNIQNLFAAFLTSSLLGKGSYYHGITLNSRTIIWKDVVDLVTLRPLLGYGSLTEQMILDRVLYGADHAHDLFLEILFRTGVLGFIFYCRFWIKPFVKWKQNWKDKGFWILMYTAIALLIISFMDYYPMLQYIYCFIAFVYYHEGFNKLAVQNKYSNL